jgi:hypothetical protein
MSIGETALFVIRTWLFYLLIAGMLTAPIVFFGRRRVHWLWWETRAFIVPVFIWMALMLSSLETGRKSLANLGEYVFISFAVPIAGLIRVALGTRVREGVCAGSLFALVCLTAAGVFWLTPAFPE